MPTLIMKLVSIATLLTAIIWRSSAEFQVIAAFVVTVSALAVVAQAVRAQKHIWVLVFLAIATQFNPILSVLTGGVPHRIFLWVGLASLGAFAASLAVLKTRPVLSTSSITGRTPGSESL